MIGLVVISAIASGVVTWQQAQNGISRAFRACAPVNAARRSRNSPN